MIVVYSEGEGIDINDENEISIENASTTNLGGVELATDAETTAGTDNEKAITPANLQAKINLLPNSGAAATLLDSASILAVAL